MATQRNPVYWLQKLAGRKTGYPLGTVARYGPDNSFASKVVVGIIPSEGAEPSELRKWFAGSTDVRHDQEINEQILQFLEQHNIQRVAMMDRIIGCPHEEGIDYPDGEVCPQCPYWAHRDRWTGRLLP
jgi:hypothetical protein